MTPTYYMALKPETEYVITDGQTMTVCATWQSCLWNVRRWIDAGMDPKQMKVSVRRP